MRLQNISRLCLLLLCLVVIGAVLAIQFSGSMATTFRRDLGAGTAFMPQWVNQCDGYNNPGRFEPRRCTMLIDCVYTKMTQVQVADTAIGGTLAGLLPTILTLLAPPPVELVQLGLIAPHRAIALSCFSIGLPGGLFKRLGPLRERRPATTLAAEEGKVVVEWELQFSILSRTAPWRHVLGKIIGDIIIVACTGVLVWRSWAINKAVMVPWKCETPVMAFSWTVGCMLWIVFTLLLLHAVVLEIRFEHLTDSEVRYRWWEVWLLPYTLRSDNHHQVGSGLDDLGLDRRQVHGIRVIWEMPQGQWYRSQLVYESVIEFLAAAIYVYGTVVYLSVLFLGAVNALQFVALTVGMFVVVRITSGTL
ncbi:hypothetical protein V8F33_003263 [Rhypophila sp. PSN 637]